MPFTYPAPPPTIAGDLVTISRFLNSPTLIARRLRTLAEQRFISDALLTGRYEVVGGAVQFEQNESIFVDRAALSVAPGSSYPRSGLSEGAAQIAKVDKWGVDAPVTDESIKRRRMDPVTKAMAKTVNSVVNQVDSVALSLIASAVIQTQAVTAAWNAASGTAIVRDILLGKAKIYDLKQGFEPDTLAVDDTTWAYVTSDPVLSAAARREDTSSVVYSGVFPVIAGVKVLPSPNMPSGVHAILLDSTQLGGMADEDLGGPGYASAAGVGVQAKTIRDDDLEQWRVRARRVTVPVVLEPSSALTFTGVLG